MHLSFSLSDSELTRLVAGRTPEIGAGHTLQLRQRSVTCNDAVQEALVKGEEPSNR
jgi:hypothetical protein